MSDTPRTDAALDDTYRMPGHASGIVREAMSQIERDLATARQLLTAMTQQRDQWRECAGELAYWLGFEGVCKLNGLTKKSKLAIAKFDALKKGAK